MYGSYTSLNEQGASICETNIQIHDEVNTSHESICRLHEEELLHADNAKLFDEYQILRMIMFHCFNN
jgi:hypothetical protein